MHDFHYFLYLGCLFTHMNIIIQVSQHSFNFFLNLSNTMLTSAFNKKKQKTKIKTIFKKVRLQTLFKKRGGSHFSNMLWEGVPLLSVLLLQNDWQKNYNLNAGFVV